MPAIRNMANNLGTIKSTRVLNWFPGHMFTGMQAMMGKLNTVDCVIEVHDARIPFTGRNVDLKKQLASVKPHILVLNKRDLADISRWDSVKQRLRREGDTNVFLTDLSGTQFSFQTRGFDKLLSNVVEVINNSDRHNRQSADHFKVMICGIPNVGKSTLVNRLRQHHLGFKGEPAKCGPQAGVTKHVENIIKICSRPPIYSLDTPGILQPKLTKDFDQTMRLALCSTISDKAVDPEKLAQYLLQYLNDNDNFLYQDTFELKEPATCLDDIIKAALLLRGDKTTHTVLTADTRQMVKKPDIIKICWKFINEFRKGRFGKVMFE